MKETFKSRIFGGEVFYLAISLSLAFEALELALEGTLSSSSGSTFLRTQMMRSRSCFEGPALWLRFLERFEVGYAFETRETKFKNYFTYQIKFWLEDVKFDAFERLVAFLQHQETNVHVESEK